MSELGQRLISIVREKAAENPDYVYPVGGGCVYMHDGQPSCIVGHALFGVGLINPGISDKRNCIPFHRLAQDLELELDESEEKWMRKVQQLQDAGWAWGRAVKRVDTIMSVNA